MESAISCKRLLEVLCPVDAIHMLGTCRKLFYIAGPNLIAAAAFALTRPAQRPQAATIATWAHAWAICSEAVVAEGHDASVWVNTLLAQVRGFGVTCDGKEYMEVLEATVTDQFLCVTMGIVDELVGNASGMVGAPSTVGILALTFIAGPHEDGSGITVFKIEGMRAFPTHDLAVPCRVNCGVLALLSDGNFGEVFLELNVMVGSAPPLINFARMSSLRISQTLAGVSWRVRGCRFEIVEPNADWKLSNRVKRCDEIFKSFRRYFRLARDGAAYTYAEFQELYGDDSSWWEEAWPVARSAIPLEHLFVQCTHDCKISQSRLQVSRFERTTSHVDPLITSVSDVIEECYHIDSETKLDAEVDGIIADVMWADFIERRISLGNRSTIYPSTCPVIDDASTYLNCSTVIWSDCEDCQSYLQDSEWSDHVDKPWDYNMIHLITFTRSPGSLSNVLHKGRELESVRVTAAEYGQSCRLPSGTSIFVHPQHYECMMKLASALQLLPYHAVVCEAFLPLVKAEIAKLRSKENVRIRKLQKMALVDSNDESICFVQQTFMCMVNSDKFASSHTTQSFSQAVGVPNHRHSV